MCQEPVSHWSALGFWIGTNSGCFQRHVCSLIHEPVILKSRFSNRHHCQAPCFLAFVVITAWITLLISQTELYRPAPDALIGDVYAALGEHILDIAKAEGKPEIEPDGVMDD